MGLTFHQFDDRVIRRDYITIPPPVIPVVPRFPGSDSPVPQCMMHAEEGPYNSSLRWGAVEDIRMVQLAIDCAAAQ